MASMSPFFRIGQPVLVPVTLTSAATPYPATGSLMALLPPVPDLTFMFWNPNPFDINLEGTAINDDGSMPTLLQVTASTGYPVPARTALGPLTSKRPVYLSAQAFPTVEQAAQLGSSFDWTNRYLWLIYGSGT